MCNIDIWFRTQQILAKSTAFLGSYLKSTLWRQFLSSVEIKVFTGEQIKAGDFLDTSQIVIFLH
jgi:hypothetical protein